MNRLILMTWDCNGNSATYTSAPVNELDTVALAQVTTELASKKYILSSQDNDALLARVFRFFPTFSRLYCEENPMPDHADKEGLDAYNAREAAAEQAAKAAYAARLPDPPATTYLRPWSLWIIL